RIPPESTSVRRPGLSSAATTVTSAPARRQEPTLLSIAPSPPTATQGRPSRHRNTGCVRIRRPMLPEAHRPQNGQPPRPSAVILRLADAGRRPADLHPACRERSLESTLRLVLEARRRSGCCLADHAFVGRQVGEAPLEAARPL